MTVQHLTFHTHCNGWLLAASSHTNWSLLLSIWTGGSQEVNNKFIMWQSSHLIRFQSNCGTASWTVKLLSFAINILFVWCRQVLKTSFTEWMRAISLGTTLCHVCCLSSRKYSTPPVTADTLCPRGISTECFEKLVSSISKGGKMLHFVYFVYIFF